jgi:hypothetical protein
LANVSAQHALTRYARRMLVSNMYSKLIVSVVALGCGTGLLAMWFGWDTQESTFYSAMMAFFVALIWGCQYAILTGRLIIGKSGNIKLDWYSPTQQGKTAASPSIASNDAAKKAEPPEEIASDVASTSAEAETAPTSESSTLQDSQCSDGSGSAS